MKSSISAGGVKEIRNLIVALSFLTMSVAHGFAPEGLETFALLPQKESTVFVNGLYNNRNFLSDSEEMQLYFTQMTDSGNALSFGGSVTVANQFGDRDAFFAKWDQVFWDTHSISFKIAHEDWKYISTSKDSIGIEYSGYIGDQDYGTYYSLGGYYRWLRQTYDDDWWVPFNFNTEDQEGFLIGVLGVKVGVGNESFFTIDANIRDTFRYYNFDNFGTDAALNIGLGDGFFFRVFAGTRWTALITGTGTISWFYGGIGIASQ